MSNNIDQDGQKSSAGNAKKYFSANVERSIISFFKFFFKLVKTIFDAIFFPSKIAEKLGEANQQNYVKPFTFFTIAAVIGGAFLDLGYFFFLLDPSKDILVTTTKPIEIKSLLETLLSVFPILFAVICFSIVTSRIIFRLPLTINNFGVQIFLIGVGAQLFLSAMMFYLAALFFASTLADQFGFGYSIADSDIAALIAVVTVIALQLASLLAAAPIIYSSLSRQGISEGRMRKFRNLALSTTLSIITMFLVIGASSSVKLAQDIKHVLTLPYGDSAFTAAVSEGFLCEVSEATGDVDILALVKNSTKYNVFTSTDIRIHNIHTFTGLFESDLASEARLVAWQGHDPVIKFASEDSTWLHIRVTDLRYYEGKNKLDSWRETYGDGEYGSGYNMYYSFRFELFKGTINQNIFLFYGNCNLSISE